MKSPLFEYTSYQYQIEDWGIKKCELLDVINSQKFVRTNLQNFETDKKTNNNNYLKYLTNLIRPQLQSFCNSEQITCTMNGCWTVRYNKGDSQSVHNHGSWGFSGILYADYNPEVHSPTHFVAPWQDSKTDATLFGFFRNVQEGTLIIFPSYTLHFALPNVSDKQRTIVSFDLIPKIAE